MTAIHSPAQTFTNLFNFDGKHGAYPFHINLVQGLDGNLFGTTSAGGANSCGGACGTVFEITTAGALIGSLSFDDGATPYAGLLQLSDGTLLGTTGFGGTNTGGTIFKISPSGALTTVYNFCSEEGCADGLLPEAALIQATNGNFYGTTCNGGAGGDGTVFEITPSGTLTTLHSFRGHDGSCPTGALVQGTDGNFYGTTSSGGTDGGGTVFKFGAGSATTLYNFADSAEPSGLIQASDGNFYGSTLLGGAGYGSVFKITAAGTLTTVYSFCPESYPCTDGDAPGDSLVQGTDGNFYGTTTSGGANGYGTIFSVTPGGALTTLHSFDKSDGQYPWSTLTQATNGNFYGTTEQGGGSGNCHGCGTVYSLSMGLGPFVEATPNFGKAGQDVDILGNNLTGATSVSLNGTPATFTVVSSTHIVATVPAGTMSGPIEVTTPSGTLSSNVTFQVVP